MSPRPQQDEIIVEKRRRLRRNQREQLANYATVALIILCALVVGYWYFIYS
ncbi:MAG: hypothetical protein WAW17_29900 [Rhodococcus sp. (in: high G+C Gram-positive bacteria)]|uniref:hypothetical protein n=1 Tax=Rhodococcus sp. TaxID=1831 RepID=UPI003BAFEE96